MVTFPINIPTNVNIHTFKMTPRNAVVMDSSPFTGHQQVQSFGGEWWECSVSLPLMNRAEAEEWMSFINLLRGPTYTFLMGDPDGATPRGVGTGTILVDGGSQTGTAIDLKGFTTSTTNILRAGDYLQIGNNLYKVLTDTDSDSSGLATVDIFPRIRTSPADEASVTVSGAKGIWRLKPGSVSFTSGYDSMYSISFDCIEAF